MNGQDEDIAMLTEGEINIPPSNNTTVGSMQEPIVEKVKPNYWTEIQSALSEGYSRQEIADYMSVEKNI